MAKKDRYNYSSPAAAGLGLAVTGVASTIPGGATVAGPLGTIATGIFGGVDLTDEEKNIKNKFDEAINKTWQQIYDDYKLTDVCFSALKQDVIGENTSTDEFVNNSQRKKLEESYALAIQFILEKYRGGLERRSKKKWDDEYIKNASKDIAARLIFTLQNVFDEDDLLKILKAISDKSNDIRRDIGKNREANRLEHEQLMQILIEISESIKSKREYLDTPPALTTIPLPPDKLIGREKAIAEIQDLMAQQKIVSIHAEGGVGKTAVAAKIVNYIKDEIVNGKSLYKHVAWITSTGDLKSDLTGLNIPLVDTVKTQEEKYQIVSAYLQSNSTFLVIDNMDEPPTREDSKELNTVTGQTKALITARADIPYAEEYPLGDLDPDSALVLLYQHFTRKQMTIEQIRDRKDYSYGEKIVERTTYNALFIELIGKMAYSDHWKLDGLWEKLSEDVFSVDSKHPIKSIHGDGKLLEHIQKLYDMSRLSRKQKEIMSFIALFPAEYSIFFDVFEWAGFEDDEEDNLGELQDRGWIERDVEGYLTHTIVKGSVRQQNGEVFFDEVKYEDLIYELIDTDQYIPNDMVFTKVRERIVVPETICRLLIDSGSEDYNTSALCNNIGAVYRAQGNYEAALSYYKKAQVIKEKMLGEEHLDTALTYNSMANVYSDQGNYKTALEYHQKVLEIQEKMLGTEHPDTAMTYGNMANIYYEQGNYEAALLYYKEILEIQEKALGAEHLDTADTYNNMANVFYDQGNYEAALEYYKKAMLITEITLGAEHPDTARTYNNMANVYSDQGNYEFALKYYKKALLIFEKVLGADHPNTAMIYNNIAIIYLGQGNYETALEYHKKTLVIREKKLGIEHPDTATTYNNMAVAYSEQGNYETALEYFNKALVIREKVLGVEHPFIAATYSNMANVYHAQGNYEAALGYYEKALGIQEKVLGAEHPDTARTYKNMALVYYAQGNYEAALEYHQKALVIREKVLGAEHPDTARTYNSMANVYRAQGNYETALEYYQKALVIFEKILGLEHPDTKGVRKNFERAKKFLNK